MSVGTLALLAAALGTDAFSLSLGLGLAGVRRKQAVILVVVVFLFHVLLPILGFWLGEIFGRVAGQWAAYVGAGVLFYLGVKMIIGSFKQEATVNPSALAGLFGIVLLGLSVSMDALSVGFTLGVAGGQLFLVAGVIGVVAGLMTAAAFILAKWVQGWVGQRAQLVGGIVLVGVSLRLLL
ncbi:MAG: manganese efflux pump [Eubacteriales bacterium]|jgi:putative Mn2+ efflux pump MntP|nr:manganese efflux pump MntP family protein [Bacillota bacterium]MBV1727515.1 manganese efflux pump MntP family protein [Desulforudis sp.]MDQ7789886.1 manganese efflux pump [Clostridia bacterium]MDZ4043931.1 manganese efflux pump [Eubacteriales bacterium]MBU4534181.1 manganese efflux pump MntP family protein [Bacillota bacterium]